MTPTLRTSTTEIHQAEVEVIKTELLNRKTICKQLKEQGIAELHGQA
jgi:hypothetical protein